jgi:hypothetical protein
MKTQEKINTIIQKHAMYLQGNPKGERVDLHTNFLSRAYLSGVYLPYANLSYADLSYANLSYADLSYANLSYANLSGTNFYHANLSGANLSYANLSETNFYHANLSGANLSYANLCNANLSGTNFYHADLSDIKIDNETIGYFSVCPEEGSYIAWKKCKYNVLVKLLIPETALRSSSTSRKCRASEAVVLEVIGTDIAYSNYDETFTYKAGDTVRADGFSTNRWSECSNGIHHFMTKKEAELY